MDGGAIGSWSTNLDKGDSSWLEPRTIISWPILLYSLIFLSEFFLAASFWTVETSCGAERPQFVSETDLGTFVDCLRLRDLLEYWPHILAPFSNTSIFRKIESR